jgi:hypothetical protein
MDGTAVKTFTPFLYLLFQYETLPLFKQNIFDFKYAHIEHSSPIKMLIPIYYQGRKFPTPSRGIAKAQVFPFKL